MEYVVGKDIIECVLVLIVGFLLGPILKKSILKAAKLTNERGILTFVGSCISLMVKIISIIIALASLGVDMSIIVGSFSAVGLGISLALKDNMANVAGGLEILFTKTFKVGDYIQIDDKEGYVERIEVMYCVLRTFDNQEIIIPNTLAVQKYVTNFSMNPLRRIHITIPVDSTCDMEMVQNEFMDVLDHDEYVKQEHAKMVVIDNFKERSITIGVYCWVTIEDYWTALFQINEKLQKKRLAHNIANPFERVKLD